MIARISRAVFSNRFTPIVKSTIQDHPPVHQHPHVYANAPTRFYLFPSIYRSFFSSYGSSIGHYQSNLSNLMPFRRTLDEIKRRLFFAGLYFHSFAHTHIITLNSSTHSTEIRDREKEEKRSLFFRTNTIKTNQKKKKKKRWE